MVELQHPKHVFTESDEDVIQRCGETPTLQYFSGNEYFEHQWPCDQPQLGRFHKAWGDERVEELLALTVEETVTLNLIAKKKLTRLIVDITVRKNAVADFTDRKQITRDREVQGGQSGQRPWHRAKAALRQRRQTTRLQS